MRSSASTVRLLAALVLCAVACVAVVVGGSSTFRLVAVGLFVLAAPGLLLVTMLRIRDGLLSLVVGMVAGPAAWTMIAMVASFIGAWWPGATVVAVAVMLGAACLVLLVQQLRASANPLDDAQHRFSAHLADEVILKPVGKHRGAFPFH